MSKKIEKKEGESGVNYDTCLRSRRVNECPLRTCRRRRKAILVSINNNLKPL